MPRRNDLSYICGPCYWGQHAEHVKDSHGKLCECERCQ